MKFAFLVTAAAIAFAAPAANAAVTINIVETASGVVATTTGSINTAGLLNVQPGTSNPAVRGSAFFFTGKANITEIGYGYIFGPTFGDTYYSLPSSSTGTPFGFNLNNNLLFLASDYISGSALNATTTYQFSTLSSLELTVGSYLFNAGSNQITLNIGQAVAAVPEPATWAMMIAGFGMIGFAARRRQSITSNVTYA